MQEWQKFENVCQDAIRTYFPRRNWIVERQRAGSYGRLDFYVRKKGPGGRRLVFECKHMPAAGLRRGDVNQALNYKACGASQAIILVSTDTPVPRTVADYARGKRVPLLSVSMGRGELVRFFRNVATMAWEVR